MHAGHTCRQMCECNLAGQSTAIFPVTSGWVDGNAAAELLCTPRLVYACCTNNQAGSHSVKICRRISLGLGLGLPAFLSAGGSPSSCTADSFPPCAAICCCLCCCVQRELAHKQSEASITGAQLQEGADASRFRSSSASRGRSSTQLSSTTSSSPAARETVLQHWLVPDKQQHYWAIWTSVFTLAACFIFAFMAGNFAVYQQSPTYKDYNKQSQMPLQVQWGPKSLEGWLVFWQTTPNNSFDVGYMISWGARCAPLQAAISYQGTT